MVDERGLAIGGASVESQGREVLTDDRGTARVTVPAAETSELTARLHDSRTTASVSAYDSAPEVVLWGLEPVPAHDELEPPAPREVPVLWHRPGATDDRGAVLPFRPRRDD